ncbi:MAG: bifunctional 2-polyprenyl-6-hydroxyphenol methylase/3-demethylubiquinol 3-O-methyltransferase UbiG [Gammaproteobacteria bacterium]|jgi:2-polyprenyl-6-hydroxyphenyl methylase / 3-demethylubiquinone-9 3-methyltransferase|nr:bifunctional 2-polyprenyl-6-hydroxyphenol methylase/3-demethylubiquinol 3-O-methyltransferase UbiG [Gammaproteobacteria bacterium]MBT4461878.1 bifunctional 2-polyprenyl-6-hydroxyphenol methylase/3-demethylubiquinol 3-O-methyltransferase UbiG [Gammaproteobacteria bacterium]MBT4654267.1 bifunctional 2-polyprenyl-6-hydroxyphenol methylase/3-demethylubiquinol 3-O-methyltransferase UbiG [Gammaproteobacteria bacterium]MBT5116293.1 bifunctional 2-polyprenyl-6-hydroxyphenol methylase/3-demethylubiqui
MNIDKKEIDNFDIYAHEWWNKRGPYKLIHNLTPIRVDYIQNTINIKGLRILDIGCGGGLLAEELSKKGAKITGLDASEKTINIAKQHAKESNLNIEYICSTLESYIEKNKKKFDVVICFELIEHVPDQEKLIHSISEVTKKNSTLFFSTINRNIVSFAFAKVIAEYFLKIVPQGTHQYEKFIKPSELALLLELAGFKIDDVSGVKLNPIDHTFSLSSMTKINYFMTSTKK